MLYVNETTGGSDLAFDPKHPNVVYAGMFDFLRRPWTLRSGGPGSGLYKSYDAGKTWVRLTDPRLRNGLPPGPINRVGVSVCYSNPNVVYAFVPVKNGLLYRSTDAGAHWQLRNSSQDVDFRPFYFSQVRCDPSNPQKVYAIAGPLLVSTDGGAKFHDAGGGGDNHDLWIDPLDPQRLLNGSDMGFHYSVNGGKTWNYDDVVPFSQVYRVGYDMDTPYHVMGGMQDHEVWRGPNELLTQDDGPSNGDWLHISDWGDGQYATADPRDPDIIYEDTHFGDLVRANLRTGERRYISPQPIIGFGTGASTYPYRFNWSAPLLLSHFNPDVMYFGGNVLFRSADQGQTWSIVSPDLTHCDSCAARAERRSRSAWTIRTRRRTAPSTASVKTRRTRKPIWYGTDNGHLEVTRNGGTSWTDVIANVHGLAASRPRCFHIAVRGHAGHGVCGVRPPSMERLCNLRLRYARLRRDVAAASPAAWKATCTSCARTRAIRPCFMQEPNAASSCRSTRAPIGRTCVWVCRTSRFSICRFIRATTI